MNEEQRTKIKEAQDALQTGISLYDIYSTEVKNVVDNQNDYIVANRNSLGDSEFFTALQERDSLSDAYGKWMDMIDNIKKTLHQFNQLLGEKDQKEYFGNYDSEGNLDVSDETDDDGDIDSVDRLFGSDYEDKPFLEESENDDEEGLADLPETEDKEFDEDNYIGDIPKRGHSTRDSSSWESGYCQLKERLQNAMDSSESLKELPAIILEYDELLLVLRKNYPKEYKYLTRNFVPLDFASTDEFLEYSRKRLAQIMDNPTPKQKECLRGFFDEDIEICKLMLRMVYGEALNFDASTLKRFLGEDAKRLKDDNIDFVWEMIKAYK